MANMGQLVRRQSSRELRKQMSYDRVEMREMHRPIIKADVTSAVNSINYGSVNRGFANPDEEEEATTTTDLLPKKAKGAGDAANGAGGDGKDVKKKDQLEVPGASLKKVNTDPGSLFTEEGDDHVSWDSKITFLLATIGYAVGLGNVWRFPYLAQKNGGGAFLIPYFIMLFCEGLPMFCLELAIGQRLRKGAVGVWNQVSPFMGGVGIASAIVSFSVALYYNTIIAWCLIYFSKSFNDPLPWSACGPPPLGSQNMTVNIECERSSPTQYFWYRETLNVSPDINTYDSFNLKIGGALFAAWLLIYFCLAKGIASSPKIVYITAIFPYVVLILFFIRGVTLEGCLDGIKHLFTPKWSKLADPVVWLEAGTQIFFSLGLGFGGLIAFASYNPVNNNCCRDALVVSFTNCMTSLFAGLVIFSVIGFKANLTHKTCLNATALLVESTFGQGIRGAPPYPHPLEPVILMDGSHAIMPNYTFCDLQKELDNTASGPGLAFIIFTDAINQFSYSPFWSILFFSMLFTLGIDSQFGTLEGVVTSITDMKLFPNLRKEVLTGVLCSLCCGLSMMFAHGAGNYIFVLFDSFAGNVPLLIIAFCECVGVAYIYGLGRFAEDIELMTGKRPFIYWMVCWKYISPVVMVVILVSSWVKIFTEGSTYPRWDKDQAISFDTEWPHWALIVAVFLVLVSVIWIPVVAILRAFGVIIFPKEEASWFPANDLRDFHGIVSHEPTKLEKLLFGFESDGSEGIIWKKPPRKYGTEDSDEDDDDIT